MGVIVVGMDGSAGAERALRWAYDEALLRGDELLVVHAWMPSMSETSAIFDFAAYTPEDDAVRSRAAAAMLARFVLDVLGPSPAVEVVQRVVKSSPADALIQQAEDAELLVVGSRGLGGFKELLLGSVSHHLVHHAPCPVVVIRPVELPARAPAVAAA